MGYACVRHYILFYIHSQLFSFFFELRKYPKITKIVCSQNLIRSLADIAEHICEIKRRSDGSFFLKHVNEHLFVSAGPYPRGRGIWFLYPPLLKNKQKTTGLIDLDYIGIYDVLT